VCETPVQAFLPAELPLLFQKGVRLKRDLAGMVQGSGLGLSLSKRLGEANKGASGSRASAEPGSRFCSTIPGVAEGVSDQMQSGYFLTGDLGSSRIGSAVLQSRDG